jgi:hypothetical protein
VCSTSSDGERSSDRESLRDDTILVNPLTPSARRSNVADWIGKRLHVRPGRRSIRLQQRGTVSTDRIDEGPDGVASGALRSERRIAAGPASGEATEERLMLHPARWVA